MDALTFCLKRASLRLVDAAAAVSGTPCARRAKGMILDTLFGPKESKYTSVTTPNN